MAGQAGLPTGDITEITGGGKGDEYKKRIFQVVLFELPLGSRHPFLHITLLAGMWLSAWLVSHL